MFIWGILQPCWNNHFEIYSSTTILFDDRPSTKWRKEFKSFVVYQRCIENKRKLIAPTHSEIISKQVNRPYKNEGKM